MGDAAYFQGNFLGGEWSPAAQGRLDLPAYKTALNLCLNAMPMEEGAWTRRVGTQRLGPTNGGDQAILRKFIGVDACPYVMEFSTATVNGVAYPALMMWSGPTHVFFNSSETVTAATFSGQLSAPSAPTLSASSGGSLASGTVYVKTTWLTATGAVVGETTASSEASQAVTANEKVTVNPGTAPTGAVVFRVYAATASGSEVLQNGNGTVVGSTYVISRLVTGSASPPSSNTAGGVGTFTLTLGANITSLAVQDQVQLSFPVGFDPSLEANCRGATLGVKSIDTGNKKITLYSGVGGDIWVSSLPTDFLVGASVLRIWYYILPDIYNSTGTLDKIRVTQLENEAIVFHQDQTPQLVSVSETSGQDPTISVSSASFVDGPYAAPEATTGTVSATSGSGVTFTPASGSPFTSADVGKHIRLFYEPATWASGTTYGAGDTVTYPVNSGQYWVSLAASNTGNIPGTAPINSSGVAVNWWAPAPQSAQWAWGKITAQGGSTCTFTYETTPALAINSLPASLPGTNVTQWMRGLYQIGNANANPAIGTYYQGRLWMSGVPTVSGFNRVDGSTADDIFTFSPTDAYGNVNDDNAISVTMNSPDLAVPLWMEPDPYGILVGTLGGEWLLTASAANEPLTPTTIQALPTSRYGGLDAIPVRVGFSMLFIQRYGRRIMEYLRDAFTQMYTGRHLNQFFEHMTPDGIAEITYQEEPIPTLWARSNDGNLVGCTYRRFSKFVTEEAPIHAGHQHILGGKSNVASICAIPTKGKTSDALYMVVYDKLQGMYFVEAINPAAVPVGSPPTYPVGGVYYFEINIRQLTGNWYGAPGEFQIGICSQNYNLYNSGNDAGTDGGFTVDGSMLSSGDLSLGWVNCSFGGSELNNFGTITGGGAGINYAGLTSTYIFQGSYVYGFVVDATNGYIYWRDVTADGSWNGGTPGSGSGTIAISGAGTSVPFYIAMSGVYYPGTGNLSTTAGPQIAALNTGASPFVGGLPSGCAPWDNSGETSLIAASPSTATISPDGLTVSWLGSSAIASAVRSSSGVLLK